MNDVFAALAATKEPEPESGRPHLWALILAALVLMVVAITVLGPDEASVPVATPSAGEDSTARIYTVSYRFGVFSPTNLRIHVGDTVRFRNEGALPIRVVSDPAPGHTVPEFDSVGPVQPGSYFSYTFSTVGVFAYQNDADESESGVIIVRE